ncbi:glycosyltransferase [Phenylobacterium sp.]|uniref:glycosyltransferase n=1 Tax=Phenylobacterium sp. TaxID=1871053 RepID=UPI0035681EB2
MTQRSPRRATAPDAIDITVIICTRNRAARLRNVLQSLTELKQPPGLRWEVVVVDNGSSDNTQEVALSFRDRLSIRVIREEQAGLSNARNRGVAEARGAYICWTDDDLVLDENWLAAYAAAFKRHPEAAIFGGRITPVLEAPTPRWFARFADEWPLTTLLAKRDFGDDIIPLGFADNAVPWGANFAVRTAEQRLAPYEPGLGVSPLQKRLGEESEVIFRIIESGGVGWWVPDSKVQHIIPVQRQTWRYVFEYFQAYGETVAYMERTWPGAHHMAANEREMARVAGGPLSLYARAALNGAVFAAAWLLGATGRSLKSLMKTGFYVGAAQIAAAPPAASRPRAASL